MAYVGFESAQEEGLHDALGVGNSVLFVTGPRQRKEVKNTMLSFS